jgi:uridylate kinase
MGEGNRSIDPIAVDYVAHQLEQAWKTGVELAVVVGGGNIWRGQEAAARGMDRATADYAGMLATLINALALQDSLERRNVVTRAQSALNVQAVAEPFIRRRAIRHLEKGRVVLFAAGTGNPYMSTDTAAALRAMEVNADILLMAKNRVDGVYDADPRLNPSARKFQHLSYLDILNRRLEIMDNTALSLCMDNRLPIIVFNLFEEDDLLRLLKGEAIGTRVAEVPEAVLSPE